MTVRLRPHHLLCMLTYVGKGYSAAFVAQYDAIAQRLSEGETVRVISGPDDICAPLLTEPDAHCYRPSVVDRDARATRDMAAFFGQPVDDGTILRIDAGLLSRLRGMFRSGQIRAACAGCEWSELCTRIAHDGYRGVRVKGRGG